MKRFYDVGEVMNYEHIENEWPLFYLYMIVDGMFEDDQEQVRFFSSAAKEAFLCSFFIAVLILVLLILVFTENITDC